MLRVRRLQASLAALLGVLIIGTVGYLLLGFSLLDAVYQTVTTVTTVGFREVQPLNTTGMIYTIVLIMVGVGTALYALGVLLETLVEGQLREVFGRRRMDRNIDKMVDHTIICGWGRVGRTIAQYVAGAGDEVIVIDSNEDRLAECEYPSVVGDATDDDTLRKAGIERAKTLVAAVDSDSANLFIIVSARALRPDLFLVGRIRAEANEAKLLRAGADRVVNPQQIGGARMAAFVVNPHVAEFLDVIMHDGSLEFRLAEITMDSSSPMVGKSLRDAQIRLDTGALVLAIRNEHGEFMTNPSPDTELHHGEVLIVVGTEVQLKDVQSLVGG